MKTRGAASRRILVVDDEPIVSDAARRMLEHLGHEVETAASPKEALEYFKARDFDLVFTDYAMPDMKGDQLAQVMKTLRPHQPVAMITAYAEMLPELTTVDMIIGKPFLIKNLQDAIEKLVRK